MQLESFSSKAKRLDIETRKSLPEKLRLVLQHAQHETWRFNHPIILTAHLLPSILKVKRSKSSDVLETAGLSLLSVRQAMENLFQSELDLPCDERLISLHMSDMIEHTLQKQTESSKALEDALWYCLNNSETAARQLLVALQVDPISIIKNME